MNTIDLYNRLLTKTYDANSRRATQFKVWRIIVGHMMGHRLSEISMPAMFEIVRNHPFFIGRPLSPGWFADIVKKRWDLEMRGTTQYIVFGRVNDRISDDELFSTDGLRY